MRWVQSWVAGTKGHGGAGHKLAEKGRVLGDRGP